MFNSLIKKQVEKFVYPYIYPYLQQVEDNFSIVKFDTTNKDVSIKALLKGESGFINLDLKYEISKDKNGNAFIKITQGKCSKIWINEIINNYQSIICKHKMPVPSFLTMIL